MRPYFSSFSFTISSHTDYELFLVIGFLNMLKVMKYLVLIMHNIDNIHLIINNIKK